MIKNEFGVGNFEIVSPSISILAEPSVTFVDNVVERRGTRDIAIAYIEFMYSDSTQRLIARHFYRPSNPEIANEFSDFFPDIKLVTIDNDFGGWAAAQAIHFADGGEFDQMITRLRRR